MAPETTNEEMSDRHVQKLIIVTPSPNFKSRESSAKSLTRTRLDDEMEHGLRRYEEELWQAQGTGGTQTETVRSNVRRQLKTFDF